MKYKQTIFFKNKPRIIGNYSIVGNKEGDGNFKTYFHRILKDDLQGEKSFEHSERKIAIDVVEGAIDNAGIVKKDIDLMLSGDLLNQIISSSFSAREIGLPYIGLYGACSTMALTLAVGGILIDGGYVDKVTCSTVSHFSSVERQYRYPLELGNQRPPTSQWTITGGGCSVLSRKGRGPYLSCVTFGKVVDYGVMDVNNMGGAMAPAAMDTLLTHFRNTKTTPSDYDLIVTGDLGKFGSDVLIDLMENKGVKLGQNYSDCGQMIFDDNQKTFQGGSGAGCSAAVFNSYILDKLKKGELKKVLFAPTGALLSPMSSQQGDSIPCICHAIVVENEEGL